MDMYALERASGARITVALYCTRFYASSKIPPKQAPPPFPNQKLHSYLHNKFPIGMTCYKIYIEYINIISGTILIIII